MKLEDDDLDFNFNDIPPECIVTDMNNNESENNPHPNLVQLAKKKRLCEKKALKDPIDFTLDDV